MKLFFIILILAFSSFSTAGESPYSLQTLFTTPSERSTLDKLYGKHKSPKPAMKTQTNLPLPVQVRMQGVLLHGESPPVAFINDTSSNKQNGPDSRIKINTSRTSSDQQNVAISVNGRTVYLKPGQVWDTTLSKPVEQNKLKIDQQDRQLLIRNQ